MAQKKKKWLPFEDVTLSWHANVPTPEEIMHTSKPLAVTLEQATAHVEDLKKAKVYSNGTYEVNITNDPGLFLHVSVKRLDRAPIRDWRVMQRIKNELVGPEHEGVELYPAESRVVDTANQYHMWVLKDEGAKIPCGWKIGLKNNGETLTGNGKQRLLEEEE